MKVIAFAVASVFIVLGLCQGNFKSFMYIINEFQLNVK